MSRAARVARAVSAVGVVGVLAAVTAGGSLPTPPADVEAPATPVVVPPTATTLVCPGPVVLPDDTGAGDAAFDPTPVETRATQRVVTTAPSGAASAGPVTLTALGGAAPLATLDGGAPAQAGGVGAVAGPTLVEAEPVGGAAPSVAATAGSVTPGGDLRGLAAASCRPPSASTWLVGGSTELGSSALLVVTNPGRTPAEVSVAIWGPTGPVDAGGASTFLVAPGAERALLLEGVAAEQRRIAVHVTAAGGLVAAHLQDSRLDGFTPAGTDLVTAGADPGTRQVVGGLVVPASGTGAEGTAQLRLLAPDGDRAVATLTLLGPDGPVTLPGAERVDLGAGEVTDVSLAGLPAGAYTAVVDADRPVLAAGMLTRQGPPVELADVPTVERAWSAAVPGGAAGLLAVPEGVGATVVVAGVPAGGDRVDGDGPPVTGTLRVLGADGRVLVEEPVSVPAGTTRRLDPAGPAGAEVAAVELVPDGTGADAAGGRGEEGGPGGPVAPDGSEATLAWSVLATVGGGPDELLSVLTPVGAPPAQPTVRVRADPRLGLP